MLHGTRFTYNNHMIKRFIQNQILINRSLRGACYVDRAARKSSAFTLIELLTVIGIIAVLLGLSIPAYNTINRGSSMRSAEQQILAGTFLARQEAVTSRHRIAFCIPVQIENANPFVRDNMLFHSYFMLAQATTTVGNPQNIVGKINVLPKGVVFDEDLANYATWRALDIRDPADETAVMFRVRAFRYAPTGSIYFRDVTGPPAVTFYNIPIREGIIDDFGTITPATGSPGIVIRQLQVNAFSGRCTLLP